MFNIKNLQRLLLVLILGTTLASVGVFFYGSFYDAGIEGITADQLKSLGIALAVSSVALGTLFWAIKTDLLTIYFKRNKQLGLTGEERRAYERYVKEQERAAKEAIAQEEFKKEQAKREQFLLANPQFRK